MQRDSGRYLVTGGAGFIGSHLVDRLLADPRAEVVIFDDLSRGRRENIAPHRNEHRLRVIRGDIRDADSVSSAMRGTSIVFHLAARPANAEAEADADDCFAVNVVGTYNVLRAAARHAVRRFVFASSRDVYGEPISLPVDEEQPLLSISSFGASKASGEAYCRAFRRSFGLETVILRFADVYGPRDGASPIPAWLEQARAGRDLYVHGGMRVIDLIWVEQVIEALVRAATLEQPLPPINVASGTGTRTIDLVRRIRRLTGTRGQIKSLPGGVSDTNRFIANVDRMRQVLMIEPPLDPLGNLSCLLRTPVGAAG